MIQFVEEYGRYIVHTLIFGTLIFILSAGTYFGVTGLLAGVGKQTFLLFSSNIDASTLQEDQLESELTQIFNSIDVDIQLARVPKKNTSYDIKDIISVTGVDDYTIRIVDLTGSEIMSGNTLTSINYTPSTINLTLSGAYKCTVEVTAIKNVTADKKDVAVKTKQFTWIVP